MPITIDLHGYEEVQKLLTKLSGRSLKKAMGTISEDVGKELANMLMEYPSKRYGAKQVFSSARHRRGFFAALRSGDINVPYRRTEDLARKWGTERRGSGAVVSNPQLYAPYVQSAERQTAMHRRTGWVTDVAAVEKVERTSVIQRIARKVIGKLLR